MKAAVRPVAHLRNVAVLDWIEMNVVDMTLKVFIIADGVLPIASLPNTLFALCDLAASPSRTGGEPAREGALNEAPAQRKIGITCRQCPDRMEVVRQHADRNCLEPVMLVSGAIGQTELI